MVVQITCPSAGWLFECKKNAPEFLRARCYWFEVSRG